MEKMKKNLKKGFTLVELLVVLATGAVVVTILGVIVFVAVKIF